MEGTEDGQHTVDRKTVGSTKKNCAQNSVSCWSFVLFLVWK